MVESCCCVIEVCPGTELRLDKTGYSARSHAADALKVVDELVRLSFATVEDRPLGGLLRSLMEVDELD
jgi:hypothetical protein